MSTAPADHRGAGRRASPASSPSAGPTAPSGDLAARTPITGGSLGAAGEPADVDDAVARATEAFVSWRSTPAPARGNLVRRLGELLREHKEALGALVSIEAGKIRSEGLGEVQEMIDICDFAVGLSRQLHGLTIASERPGHRLMETWHPMGPCAVITAFNFPVAVWSWNAALALVAGDPVLWKPSDKTPLTALACDALLRRAAADVGAPDGLNQVLQGGADVGAALAAHEGVAIVSATGSTRMGRAVAPVVASRFGRLILELGGNNAAVVAPSADLELAVRGIAFSAVGTAGQRCTSLRRLIVHESVRDELVDRLAKAYATVPIGDPLGDGTLVGPLIDGRRVRRPRRRRSTSPRETAASSSSAAGASSPTPRPMLATSNRRSSPCRARPRSCAPRRSARCCTSSATTTSTRRSRCTTTCPRAWRRASSPTTSARPSGSCRPRGPTAASPTSTSAHRAPRSAERSAARRRPAAAASRAPTPGRAYMRRATNTINYSTSLPLAQGVTFDID